MKRVLVILIIAMLCGIYASCLAPDFIPTTFLFCLLFVLLISSFFVKRSRVLALAVLFLLVGAFSAQVKSNSATEALYPYLDEYITITADVIRRPEENASDGSHTLMLRVQDISFLKEENIPIRGRVLVKLRSGEKVPEFGDTITAVCRFYEPMDAMNQGGFDSARYLKSQNIFFRGTIEGGTLQKEGHFSLGVGEWLYTLNQKAGDLLSRLLPPDEAAVMRAMVLGDNSHLSDSLSENLQLSGLSHMVAVSGMHLSVLVSVLYGLLSLLGGSRRRRNLLILSAVLFFVFFTGASVAVVRAGIMVMLALVAQLIWRKEDSLTSLAVSAGVLLFINPLIAFDAGFMLSFAATLGIVWLSPLLCKLFRAEPDGVKAQTKVRKAWTYLGSYLAVTLSAQLFLLPVCALIFGYSSLWTFPAGLLTLPLGSVMLIGGGLTCLLGLLHPIAALPVIGFTYPFIWLFVFVVKFFGGFDSGLLIIGSFSAFGFYVYGLFLFCIHRALRGKVRQALAVGLAVVVLLSANVLLLTNQKETAELTFINVGQGDCSLIRLPDSIDVLIDAGGTPEYRGNYDVGKNVVLPYLRKQGVRELEYVVATHPHADHIGGLFTILEKVPIKHLLVPIGFGETEEGEKLLKLAKEKGVLILTLDSGDELTLAQDTSIRVLMPDSEWLAAAPSENDRSLVFTLSFGETKVLFAADAEADSEWRMMESPPTDVDILKVGHHGSANSTQEAFLTWSNPEIAYIPCGENDYKHPSAETLKRLENHGATIYRADEDKDVRIVLSRTGIRRIAKGGETQ